LLAAHQHVIAVGDVDLPAGLSGLWRRVVRPGPAEPPTSELAAQARTPLGPGYGSITEKQCFLAARFILRGGILSLLFVGCAKGSDASAFH
jgi:hypothetical protein